MGFEGSCISLELNRYLSADRYRKAISLRALSTGEIGIHSRNENKNEIISGISELNKFQLCNHEMLAGLN